MLVRQAVNTLQQVIVNASRLGATIPKAVRAEHDQLAALAEKTRNGLQIPDTLPAAILDALAAGRDPATDPATRDAVIARQVAACTPSVETALNGRVEDFLHRNAQAILDALAKPFDAAAITIAAVCKQLGDVDLGDTRAVLARGGTAAQLWADAQAAEATIKTVRDTVGLFGAVSSRYAVDGRYPVLVYADIPADRFLDEQLTRVAPPAYELAQRGFRLSLATGGAVRERIDAVRAEVTRREAQRDDARRAAFARTHGTGVIPQDAA